MKANSAQEMVRLNGVTAVVSVLVDADGDTWVSLSIDPSPHGLGNPVYQVVAKSAQKGMK